MKAKKVNYIALLFIILAFSLSNVIAQDTVISFQVSPPVPSLVGPAHTMLGNVIKLADGRLLHIFRLDPGDGGADVDGNHVGNSGYVAKRYSNDDGATWSDPEIVYDDEFDDRNCTANLLDNGDILVFFQRYNATSTWSGYFVDVNMIRSSDNGNTWTDRQVINPLQGQGIPCFQNIFKIQGKQGYFVSTYCSYYADIRYSSDGNNWDSVYCKWNYMFNDSLNISEPTFTSAGNGKVIGLFRVANSPIYQTVSYDYGKTWSLLESTSIANGFTCPGPNNLFDNYSHSVLTVVTDRRGASYDIQNLNCDLWVYMSDPDNIMQNPMSYTNPQVETRPNPNTYLMIGYSTFTKINDTTYILLFSDSYKKPNGLEDADFYQCYITIQKTLENHITFDPLPQVSYGINTFFTPVAFATSNLPVEYISTDTSIAKVENGQIQIVGAGTVNIIAHQPGNAKFGPAPDVVQVLTVVKANQTILFNPIPKLNLTSPDFALMAMASSNLPISFESTDTSIAKIVAGKLQIVGAGIVDIIAHQNGNSLYNPAPEVFQILSIAKACQTIVFYPIPELNLTSPDFMPMAIASSKLPVSFESSDTSVANIINGKIHVISAGSCTIYAKQNGNAIYDSALTCSQTLTVSKIQQSIFFNPLPELNYDSPDFIPMAFASSNLPVAFIPSDTNVVKCINGKLHIVGVGICNVSAIQSGDDFYAAAPQVLQKFVVNKANQTIHFGYIPQATFGDNDVPLSASASSGLPVNYMLSDTSIAKIINGKIHILGAGICYVIATQSGDNNYNAAPQVSQTCVVNKANQTIHFDSIPPATFGDSDIPLSASANSGLPINYMLSDTSIAKIINGKIHVLGAGICNIIATQSGDNNYNAAPQVSQTFVVNKANQTIQFDSIPQAIFGDSDVPLSASASSELPINYMLSDTSIAEIINGKIHVLGAGICNIIATQSGDNNHNAAPQASQTIVVNKANQTIHFDSIPQAIFGDSDIPLSASANSELPINYMLSDTSIAEIINGKIHVLGAGICNIIATQSGDNNHNAAPQASQTIVVNKANQTIHFDSIPQAIFGDLDIPLSASASSGLPVNYMLSDTSIAKIINGKIHVLGAGICNIIATQSGDNNHNAAPQASQTIVVNKANQTIHFDSIPQAIFGDLDIPLSASASSGLPVNYMLSDTSIAKIINGKIHILGAGICYVIATQFGDNNHNAAPQVSQTIVVNKANQTIHFDSIPQAIFGDLDIPLSASASSGLPVNYMLSDTSIAKIINGKFHILNAGICNIIATQSGDNNHNAAPQVSQTFVVNKANQTIHFDSIPQAIFGDSDIPLSASASAGLPVNYMLSDTSIAKIINGKLHVLNAGICYVIATQSGDNNYNAAPQVSQTFVVNKANQTIHFGYIPQATFGDNDVPLSAYSNSGLPVKYILSDTSIAKIINGKLHILSAGICYVISTQSGDNNYNAAPQISQTFVVNKANQTISFSLVSQAMLGDSTIVLSAMASSGLPVTFSSLDSLVATISNDNHLNLNSTGSCNIIAEQQGNVNFNAAPFVIHKIIIVADTNKITNLEEQPSTVVLYPNPTSGRVTITNVQNSTIDIYTMNGKSVLSFANSNEVAYLDLSTLNDGIYIVKVVKYLQKTICLKIILMR